MTELISPAPRSGLAVVWDVIVAPKTAFEALSRRGTWVWAFALVCALGMTGSYLQVPAGQHVVAATFERNAATDPNLASLSPEKRQRAVAFAVTTQKFAWLAFPIIAIVGIALGALVLLVASAVGGGTGTYGRLFALAANVAIVSYGLAPLLVGLLVLKLGPDAFSSTRDIVGLLPSLARFAPPDAPKLAVLLAAINPFTLWSFALTTLGLQTVARVKLGVALVAAAIVVFSGNAFGAAFAR